MELKNKVFLITGGASGLGQACAERFIKNGAKVVILDFNEKKGIALALSLGDQARFVKADVTNEDDVKSAIKVALSELGGIRGAICCAGIGTAEKIVNKEGKPHSLKNFTKTIEVNLIGTFNVIRLVAAAIVEQGESKDQKSGAAQKQSPKTQSPNESGVFIATASIAAFEGQWGQSAYAASKGGIVSMTLPIARELSPMGMRMMTIAPGIFETPMLAGLPDEVRDSLGKMVPFPSRLGDPAEFAALAQHIVENEMLNGTVIRLDGAMRMQPR
jgi:NAD(P)-dependent dehydrogenase (short-subunit alcohol dehydrogenase family)